MNLKSITSEVIEPYTPKNFAKEYWDLKGSAQYPMFLAVSLGLKPVFDDWINISKYDLFVEVCKKYNMIVIPDIIFNVTKSDKNTVVGGENVATTYFDAKRFSKKEKSGEVHVIISKSRQKALEAKKFAWYPVCINKRSTNKPFIDNMRFGKALGFPDCCVDFSRVYNNWHIYSHPYEIYKNTPRINGKARGSYYCNNFLMDNTHSFIHHLPCSYRCKKTINWAREIERKFYEVEPDFVEKAIEILKKPLLIFSERNFIIFNGKLSKNGAKKILEYDNCEYIKNPSRPEEAMVFFDSIKEGNNLILDNNNLIIKDNNSIIKTIEKKPQWFVLDFD